MGRKREEINNLFAYGTLMIEDIFLSITGQNFKSSTGIINNYICCQVKNKNYPGLISGEGKVSGIIYYNLPPEIISKLDTYEGQEYHRQKVSVNTTESKQITAWCYLYKTELKTNLLNTSWSLAWYHQNNR